jgi:hypothetical protein
MSNRLGVLSNYPVEGEAELRRKIIPHWETKLTTILSLYLPISFSFQSLDNCPKRAESVLTLTAKNGDYVIGRVFDALRALKSKSSQKQWADIEKK